MKTHLGARTATALRRVAAWLDEHPDVDVTRSPSGNLALMRGDRYIGWADILTGDVTLIRSETL